MKKKITTAVLLFMSLTSIFADEDNHILLYEEVHRAANQRNETGISFHAEILSNEAIKILASEITSFNVKILDASGTSVLYQGVTIDGIFHITGRALSTGHYVLKVETHECSYIGEFSI